MVAIVVIVMMAINGYYNGSPGYRVIREKKKKRRRKVLIAMAMPS